MSLAKRRASRLRVELTGVRCRISGLDHMTKRQPEMALEFARSNRLRHSTLVLS